MLIVEILLILLGFSLLIKGADVLVEGASNIAKKFKIPEIVIAMTIVSIGTSLPELVVSLSSAIEGHSDISVGNVVGSNLANLLLILGVCALIKPLSFQKQTKFIENPINLFATVILLIVANGFIDKNMISRVEGFILILGCIAFILYNLYMAKNAKKVDKESLPEVGFFEKRKIKTGKSIIGIIIGIILLKIGGDLVVEYASKLATRFGMSEKLISVTIIALATSLPELITSITATLRGQNDLAIGNTIGSNIFNIFLILGTSAMISPIPYSLSYNKDLMIVLIGAILFTIAPFLPPKNKMSRFNGLLFLAIYLSYITYVIISNI